MMRHPVFSSISMDTLVPAGSQMAAARQPVTTSVQLAPAHGAMLHPAMLPSETFLSSLSLVLAAIVAAAELVRLSGHRARRRAGAGL